MSAFDLDAITIKTPCKQDWTRMSGDERVRHCRACQRNVFNFSAMKRAEVEALLVRTEGGLCARYFRRLDGSIATADCGYLRKARRDFGELVLAGGFSAGVFFLLAGFVVVALVTLFGDNIRKQFGHSAGGIELSPPSPSIPKSLVTFRPTDGSGY